MQDQAQSPGGRADRWVRADAALTAMIDRIPGWKMFRLVVVMLLVLVAIGAAIGSPPFWVTTKSDPPCKVRNSYGEREWYRARSTVATWTGPCLDGVAEGWGRLEWLRDDELALHYEGALRAGRIDGLGTMIDRQGARYDGVWKEGIFDRGTASYPDGRRFTGDWYMGKWSKGVLTRPDGVQAEGDWYNGMLDGKGTASMPGGRYTGDWYKGQPEGIGVLQADDGTRYEGEWRNGRINGQGTMTTSGGRTFAGTWKNGCLWREGRWMKPWSLEPCGEE